MLNRNKKGKKKGTVVSLETFLGGSNSGGTVQVVKKISNIDGSDSDDSGSSTPVVLQLPTGPKAQRIFDDESIPHTPPFTARLSNLPFDANEDDIRDFFGDTPIASLRLPREDGDTGRVRGYGNIEFESREDLIHFLSLPDPTIKGRRIRIELQSEYNQQYNNDGQRSNRRGYTGFSHSSEENRESTNWRQDSNAFNTERNLNLPRNFGNQGNFNRNNSTWRQDAPTNREADSSSGSWRTASNRPLSGDFTSWRDNRRQDNDDFDRNDRRNSSSPDDKSWRNNQYEPSKSSWRNDQNERREYRGQNRNYERREESIAEAPVEERPRLNLQPRSLPLPEIVVRTDAVMESEAAASPKVPHFSDEEELNEGAALGERSENAEEPESSRTPENAEEQ